MEYIEKPYVPEIDFPIFPTLADATDNGNGTVSVPSEWIVRIAEYKIRIEQTEKTLSELRELYAE